MFVSYTVYFYEIIKPKRATKLCGTNTAWVFYLGLRMFLAQRIELRPTKQQEQFLAQCCGIKRFVFNASLEYWNTAYKAGDKPNKKSVTIHIQQLKKEYSWIKDVSAKIPAAAIDDLDDAFIKFFRKLSKYPRFKKKNRNDAFSLREKVRFTITGRKLRIERLKTRIKMRQKLRFNGTPKQITIRKRAGKWFASILIETDKHPNKPYRQREPSVGVDLGVKQLATLSDGITFENPKLLQRQLKKLAKLQKQFSRKKKGSNNRNKLKEKISKLHYYVWCKRQAVLHELTTYLTKHYTRIVIEDLNVSGMMKNRKLSRAISDAGFGEFRRQLEYKSKWYNNELVIADRFFPSSKTCSNCGNIKKDLTLSDRVYTCSACGFQADRDDNASINLNNFNPVTGCSAGGTKPKRLQESSKTRTRSGVDADGRNFVSDGANK